MRATVSAPRTSVRRRFADLDEEAVTDRVAEAVVDRLEVVEVEQQDRQRLAVVTLPLQGVVDAVVEQGPVRQAGHGVVEGLVLQLLLERALLADVAGVQHDAGDVRVGGQVVGGHLDGQPVPFWWWRRASTTFWPALELATKVRARGTSSSWMRSKKLVPSRSHGSYPSIRRTDGLW